MKTTIRGFWPTKNLRSFEILGFLCGSVAEDSQSFGACSSVVRYFSQQTTLHHITEQPNLQNVRAQSTLPFIC